MTHPLRMSKLTLGLVAALAAAWATNFGGIRDLTAEIAGQVGPALQSMLYPLQQIALAMGDAGVASGEVWEAIKLLPPAIQPVAYGMQNLYVTLTQAAAMLAAAGWQGRAEDGVLLDPCCGSGHFLLGGFHRLVELWRREKPGLPEAKIAQNALDAVHGVDVNPYAAAIARHERWTGQPAPEPTEPGAKGQPRLSARFVEWMMAQPPGWITDTPGITRNEALKLCGNGVVTPQAVAALRVMLARLDLTGWSAA